MNYSLRIRIRQSHPHTYPKTTAYRLRIDVEQPPESQMDANIFMYHRVPYNPYSQVYDDIFIGVASPVDLSEYPILEPNSQTTFPFFRLPYVELDFRNPGTDPMEVQYNLTSRKYVLEQILFEIRQLQSAVRELDNLVEDQTLVFEEGDALDSISESESESYLSS